MILTIFGTFLALLIVYWYVSKPKNLPPGPNGFPLIGMLPQLFWNIKRRGEYFDELSKIYGDIFTIRVGFSHILVLNSVEAVKEAYVHDAFSGRGLPFLRDNFTNGKGILTAEGAIQKVHRRFLLRLLRDFGFGKVKLEEPIIFEISEFFQDIDNLDEDTREKTGYDVNQTLMEYVMNTITKIAFGKRFDKKNVKRVYDRLVLASQVSGSIFIINAVPSLLFLGKLPIFNKILNVENIFKFRVPLQEFVSELLEEHHKTFEEDYLSDVLHTYIAEQRKHKGADDEYWWDDEAIMHIGTELLVAGTETTKSTIVWGLNLLSVHRVYQEKVQREIESVTGNNRQVLHTDQTSMPFLDAVCQEVLRYSALAHSGIPHETLEETKLRSWTIPKRMFTLSNHYGTLRGADFWEKPNTFDPEKHYLSDDGKSVINREKSIPFGLGKRSCIGESLARMETFLFLGNILQRYDVSLPPIKTNPIEASGGLFRLPMNTKFIFKRRI